MKPEVGLHLSQSQRQQMVPKMVQAGEIMMMTRLELEAKLENLVEDNPLVDIYEGVICYGCGFRSHRFWERCPRCGRYLKGSTNSEVVWEEFAQVSQKTSWQEMWEGEIEMFVSLTEREKNLVRVIVANLDREGFLRESREKLAYFLKEKEETLERVIEKVRSAGFLGFAARDTVDFLLLQLRQKKVAGELQDEARLRRLLHVSPQEFHQLFLPYLGELFFSPLQAFEFSLENQERQQLEGTSSALVPDAEVIEGEEGNLEVILVDSPFWKVSLNQAVLEWYRKKKKTLSPREKEYFQSKLAEARETLSCVGYRHRLFLRVVEYIVQVEAEFFRQGFKFFVPLSQQTVAENVGVSISAVCQVLKGKSLKCPDGITRDFKFFFDSSYPVKEMIKLIISKEDPARPLSDKKIGEELRSAGFSVARRTVALYRGEIGILPSHLRKKLLSAH
ncbi:MAG: polymerase sigma-54 factor [Candidatus Atribacteria bacterium]|nr:polymerase sigma-54 factor [Candidatus Atribacteria bacterium]